MDLDSYYDRYLEPDPDTKKEFMDTEFIPNYYSKVYITEPSFVGLCCIQKLAEPVAFKAFIAFNAIYIKLSQNIQRT